MTTKSVSTVIAAVLLAGSAVAGVEVTSPRASAPAVASGNAIVLLVPIPAELQRPVNGVVRIAP
jgi:hypothetical protein